MATIEQRKERYLRSPRLTTDDTGTTLAVVAWEPGGERVLRFRLGDDGAPVDEPETTALLPAVPLLHPRTHTPVDDSALDLEAWDRDARAYVVHRDGTSEVVLERDGRRTCVFRARGIAMAPALACTDSGTYVAFHTDVREDSGVADVAKWIAVRFVDAEGRVLEPSAPMTGRDRDREGVEQSFEFPALVVGRDGAVALFGRGSHDFFRQDLAASGFGERRSLSDGEWGSRGRRVTAVRRADGRLVVARRDRKGIVVDVQDEPTGGPPALVPSEVPSELASVRPARRAADPAAYWGLRTFFGDIQQHSAHSDGVGSADEVYLRARHRYGDDFVALTDHESFLGKRTGPGEWAYLEDVAERYDEPGAFATLLAYEWTGARHPGPGHKCVYLPERGLPIVSRDDVPRGVDLVRAVGAQGGIASPHHIGWTGADEEAHHPVHTPVWEICSCHGCYEYADHPLGQRGDLRDQMVDVMLRRGHRFGFTASTDSHGLLYHHGESRKRDPYRTGLTAVQTESLSRDAVLDALRNRRCYATSGVKILLDVRVDGAPMGSTIVSDGPVLVEVQAVGTDVVERVDLVGPEGTLLSVALGGREVWLMRPVEAPFVYARVVQRDGEMAWSSPVFVDRAPVEPDGR